MNKDELKWYEVSLNIEDKNVFNFKEQEYIFDNDEEKILFFDYVSKFHRNYNEYLLWDGIDFGQHIFFSLNLWKKKKNVRYILRNYSKNFCLKKI